MKDLKLCFNGIYFCSSSDTLDGLANKFSTSKELIVKDNNLSGEISRGDALYVKSYKTVYVVDVADTPESAAKKLNLTVDEMYRLNRVNYIYPFMRLVSDKGSYET